MTLKTFNYRSVDWFLHDASFRWSGPCGHSLGIRGWLWFSCGAHCGGDLISVFHGFFAGAAGVFLLVGRGAGLSFYGV